jgi:hypothetical protein
MVSFKVTTGILPPPQVNSHSGISANRDSLSRRQTHGFAFSGLGVVSSW